MRTKFEERFPARITPAAQALAANVKRLRTERGLTQTQLARLIGVEKMTISLIENARSNLTLAVLENLAEQFDIPAGELLLKPPLASR
jgi:transcriptional regulator with XRE-family HTH domain